MLSRAPGMGHTGVTATPPFPPLLGGDRQHWPAWRGTEKSTTKHPVRWLGKPALELGSGRDVASVTMSSLGAVSPQAVGQWQKCSLVEGGQEALPLAGPVEELSQL